LGFLYWFQSMLADQLQRFQCRCVLRRELQCVFKRTPGLRHPTPHDQDAAKIEVWELVAAVAFCTHGLPEPRDRLVEPAEVDEVDADVVIGIPIVRVDSDGLLALGDGLLEEAPHAQRPTTEGIALGGGKYVDGFTEALDGALVLAEQMKQVTLFPEHVRFPRGRDRIARLPGQ